MTRCALVTMLMPAEETVEKPASAYSFQSTYTDEFDLDIACECAAAAMKRMVKDKDWPGG